MAKVLVDDALWVLIEPHLLRRKARRTGRPRVPDRAALTGIILVLRTGMPWEYLPGSTAYFVWTQERADADGVSEFDASHSYRVVSRAPANNVFLVKVAHHFDL